MVKVKLSLMVAVVVLALIMTIIFVPGCKETTTEITAAETTVEETTTVETTAAETTTAEPVELVVWQTMQPDLPYPAFMEDLNKRVKEKYNISIKWEPQPRDTWEQAVTAAGVSKTGPDVLFSESGYLGIGAVNYGRKGLFLPLNDLLPEGMYDKISGWGGVTDSEDGNIYAVPYLVMYRGISYNKSLFDKAKIDYSGFPKLMYWDEFIDVCQKLKDAGITPIAFANKEGYATMWWSGYSITSYFNSNQEMSKYFQSESMNSQPFIDNMEKLKFLYDKGYFLKEGLTLDHATNNFQQFNGGKAAMQFMAGVLYKTSVEALGDKVGVTFWPYFSDQGKLAKSMNTVSTYDWGITPWSKHPEQAMLLIQEMIATQEGADAINGILGSTPTYKEWKSPEVAEKNEWTSFDKAVVDLMSKGEVGAPSYEYWSPDYQTAFCKFINMFLTGDITIEEFAKELDTARGIK
ncbi:MAG: ABC transporter substrate-binding protein [Actinobacteria bacterium]|nr:ABC transporter substrate-binding protein [Actinomycetota bacterium]